MINFKIKGTLLALGITLFPITYLLFNSESNYYDEFFVLVLFAWGIYNWEKLIVSDKQFIWLLCLYYFFGAISNIGSSLNNKLGSIFIDALTSYKPFLVFFLLKNLTEENQGKFFVRKLTTLSKIYIFLASIFSVVSQFVQLGMTSGERFGIKAFHFYFENHSAFGISIIAATLLLAVSGIRNKDFVKFYFLGLISLILTTKGVIYVYIIISFVLLFMIKVRKIRLFELVLLGVIVVSLSAYQINQYFYDTNSPRMVLILKSLDVAKEYLPLGSGFGTYGGEQASKNYSSLYNKYQLYNTYGLSKDEGTFLNDDYMAMILAQTGYAGYVCFLLLELHILSLINKSTLPNRSKSLVFAATIMLLISTIATGIVKSINGVFLFSILGIILSIKKQQNADKSIYN